MIPEVKKFTRGPYCWLVNPDGSRRGIVYDVIECDNWIDTPIGKMNNGWSLSTPRYIYEPAPSKPPRFGFLRRLFTERPRHF